MHRGMPETRGVEGCAVYLGRGGWGVGPLLFPADVAAATAGGSGARAGGRAGARRLGLLSGVVVAALLAHAALHLTASLLHKGQNALHLLLDQLVCMTGKK